MTTAHTFDLEEVMAYLDGQQADEIRAAAARAHLETCETCRELASSIKGMAAHLAEWRVESAPASVRLPVAAWLEPPAGAAPTPRVSVRITWLRWPRLAAVAAGLALLMVAGAVTVQRGARLPTDVKESAEGRAMADFPPPPPAMPAPVSRSVDRLTVEPESAVGAFGAQAQAGAPSQPPAPMVARVATLGLSTDRFDDMRAAVERLTATHEGRIASLAITGESNRRALAATLRVPSARLDPVLGLLRGLGRVRNESIGTEDVTSEFMDLSIRVANSRREEQRLLALLSDRTGKLSEVLEVERAIARVRTEVERMEASLTSTKDRVDLSTIHLRIEENYRAEVALGPVSVGARFRNAVVDGGRTAAASVVGALIGAIQIVPTLTVWALLLVWPVRWVARRTRQAIS
jgi:hypothetical protein